MIEYVFIPMHAFIFAVTDIDVMVIPVALFPRYGSVLGGTLIQVFGPCFNAFMNSSIACHFDEIETRGLYADDDYIVCVSPSLEVIGRVSFKIIIEDFLIESEEVYFYSCKFIVNFILSYEVQEYI